MEIVTRTIWRPGKDPIPAMTEFKRSMLPDKEAKRLRDRKVIREATEEEEVKLTLGKRKPASDGPVDPPKEPDDPPKEPDDPPNDPAGPGLGS